MVGRSRRGKTRTLLGNHQRCWLWGRHLVLETLAAGRWPILELWLADDLPPDEIETVRSAAAARQIPLKTVPRPTLANRCPREDHQGYAARMPPFPHATWDSLSLSGQPLCLVLDAIQDPFNFGAILRSAEVFAIDAVLIGTDRQADVSSHVARASAGAVNRVPILRDDLLNLVRELKSRGLRLWGASEKGDQSLDQCDFRPGCAIVIGNEGHGLRPEIQAACDALIRIPQVGHLNSLNAAAAAAVLCYEARRQHSACESPLRKTS